MAAVFVTTMDNPWNFFKQFDEWYAFDTGKAGYDVIGQPYNTLNYVARLVEPRLKPGMSDEEREMITNEVVDEICKLNLTGNYKKVFETDS